jgi:Apea-like HEPN
MRVEIDRDIARQLNGKAEVLLATLAVEPEKRDHSDAIGTFRPHYLMSTVNLTGREVPSAPVNPAIGIAGNEVARYFPDLDPPVGLSGKSHEEFIELCQMLQDSESLRLRVSMTFMVETVFEWMRLRYQGKTSQPMAEYVAGRCESEIAEHEVWIPVAGTEVGTEIDMGKVVLKPVDQSRWQRWVAEWHSRRPEGVEAIQRFLSDIGTELVSVAAIKVTAEPIRAVELALEETEDALSVLRYFSFANIHPQLSIYTTVSGKEHIERPRHMILRNGLLISAGKTELNMRSRHAWRIDASLLTLMRERGFDTLVRLLGKEDDQRTEFQSSLMRAINIYSKSSLSQDLNDKLLYVITALEYILLKDSSESLQKHIGERMALLIGRSLEDRLEIIKGYKRAYALRSAAVHHGETLRNAEELTNFMRDAWHTFKKLIGESDRFLTKLELIESIDDLKFS